MIVGQNITGHTNHAVTNVLLFIAFSTRNIADPFYRTQDEPRYALTIAIILVCLKGTSVIDNIIGSY
jgi:hypothetical protein